MSILLTLSLYKMGSKSELLFSTIVRKSTRKIHSISDALVNTKFAISLHNEKVWAGGLFVFYRVFNYLEDAKQRLNNPALNALFFDETLYRAKLIEKDLDHYLGSEWRHQTLHPSVENYLSHLKQLEVENPLMLSAYVYHLYLGLLSGGQILASKRRLFGENKKQGEAYCDKVTDFKSVDILKLKTQFREALNKLAEEWDEPTRLDFINESNKVFLLNNSIVGSIESQSDVIKSLAIKVFLAGATIVSIYVAWKMYK